VSEKVNRKCHPRNTTEHLQPPIHRPWAPQYTSSQLDE